ncbi:MAG: carboxylating nicotinate-nucleotide diphosphorylase [Calditrichia bacterium]|nr:carboxylating nicotinate-nucleotide diphosphorylase [Calditrichia bacterium]
MPVKRSESRKNSQAREKYLEKIVRNALQEDLGRSDITSMAIVPPKLEYEGSIVVKEDGIIAGLNVAELCFKLINPAIQFDKLQQDGNTVSNGTVVSHISGSARNILSAERVALNFLQRMSGIATLTGKYVEAVKGTGAIILDTRKTVPGLRVLDKWAVTLGGGQNHRFGLDDMILIKENHIAVAGGLAKAVHRVRKWQQKGYPVEIEVTDLAELKTALQLPVDRILLDNMTPEELKNAVIMAKGRIPLEASGNINLQNISKVARTGVNYISIGALTHSAKALDMSLLLQGTV